MGADAEWNELTERFPHSRVFIYGTGSDALVYTFDADREQLIVEFLIVNGALVP